MKYIILTTLGCIIAYVVSRSPDASNHIPVAYNRVPKTGDRIPVSDKTLPTRLTDNEARQPATSNRDTVNGQQQFKLILESIAQINSSSSISEEAMTQLRQTAWQFGDEAIRYFGNKLAVIKKPRLSKDEAVEVVNILDVLEYFAEAEWPEARKQIRRLATRPIAWNEKNYLAEPIAAKISFEAFQLFAKYHPEEAKEFIQNINAPYQEAYVYHFMVGQKSRGAHVSEIADELKTEVDSETVEAALR